MIASQDKMVFLERAKLDGRVKCRGCKKKFKFNQYLINNTHLRRAQGSPYWHIKCYGKFTQRVQCLRNVTFPDFCYPPRNTNRNRNNINTPDDHRDDPDISKLDDPRTIRDIMRLFPDVVPWKERPFLILPKDIDAMTVKELKLELAKRDCARGGRGRRKKEDLSDALKRHLDQVDLRQRRSNIVAIGYCRRMEGKEHKLNIPIYLKQIVVDYFGVGLWAQYEAELNEKHRKRMYDWLCEPGNEEMFHCLSAIYA